MLKVENLDKTFSTGGGNVHAVQKVSFTANDGEVVAIIGASGSGKSTLLSLLGLLDSPDAGSIDIDGVQLANLDSSGQTKYRSTQVGFVFQQFNLIPVLTAIENVELPLKLTNLKKAERLEHAATALTLVGLGDRLSHYPRQLSGGQEQRVAIARAIVTDPALILADEPTGNLDAASAQEVLTILAKLNSDFCKTVVMVTHDPHAAQRASVIHHLEKGELLEQGVAPA
jgi:putative ABC transport system ATP-binding protein